MKKLWSVAVLLLSGAWAVAMALKTPVPTITADDLKGGWIRVGFSEGERSAEGEFAYLEFYQDTVSWYVLGSSYDKEQTGFYRIAPPGNTLTVTSSGKEFQLTNIVCDKSNRSPFGCPLLEFTSSEGRRMTFVRNVQFNEAPAFAEQHDRAKYNLYKMETQIGTIASLEFFDEHNRNVWCITYGNQHKWGNLNHLAGPRLLLPQIVTFYYRDEAGKIIKEETHDFSWQRHSQSEDRIYDEAGKLKIMRFRGVSGIVSYEKHFAGRDSAELHFDGTGKRFIGARGKMPADWAATADWSKPHNGMVCAAGMNGIGKLQDLRVYLMVWNRANEQRTITRNLPYQEIRLELVNEEGKPVPQDTAYIKARDQELARINHGSIYNDQWQTVEAGHAVFRSFELSEWYSNLPAGDYTLMVRRRAGGKDFPLSAPPVRVRVKAE